MGYPEVIAQLSTSPKHIEAAVYTAIQARADIESSRYLEPEQTIQWNTVTAKEVRYMLADRIGRVFPLPSGIEFPSLIENSPPADIFSDYDITKVTPVYTLPTIPLPVVLSMMGFRYTDLIDSRPLFVERPKPEHHPEVVWLRADGVPPAPRAYLATMQTALWYAFAYPEVLKETAVVGYSLDKKDTLIAGFHRGPWILHKVGQSLRVDTSFNSVKVPYAASLYQVPQDSGGI